MPNVTFQPEERARSYKSWKKTPSRWRARATGKRPPRRIRELLDTLPDDVSGYNRLGKALSELGHYAEAREAYNRALEIDPGNNIARKNIERLKQAQESGEASDGAHANNTRADRSHRSTSLHRGDRARQASPRSSIRARSVLVRVSAGDQARLHREGRPLYVENAAGERIGRSRATAGEPAHQVHGWRQPVRGGHRGAKRPRDSSDYP